MAEREEGVGWGKSGRASGPIHVEEPRSLTGVASVDPEEALLLALRTCATHPAGPLRAVAQLLDTDDPGGVVARVAHRFTEQDMPEDRRLIGERFLRVLGRAFPSRGDEPDPGFVIQG